MELWLLIFLVFFLMALRVPIAFALLLSSIIILIRIDVPLTLAVTQTFTNIHSFTLLAIPFFLLLGRMLNESQLTTRLVDFSNTVVGHVRGGLGHINVMVSMVFASVSGSASADTASVGALMIPAMKKAGYSGPFSAAITAASSTLGGIIPPSIIMVIYGSFGGVSIGAMFLGGIVPGLLLGFAQMAYTYLVAVRYGYGAMPRSTVREMGRSFYNTFPVLVIPVLILGGITSGIFSATEAAVIAAIYAFLLAAFRYRTLPLKEVPKLLGQATVDFSLPIFAIACAGIFGWLISFLGAAEIIEKFILGYTDTRLGIFVSIVLFLLLIGTFLSPITAVVIFMPIIQRLGETGGIDSVHLGVCAVMALVTGLITPPYGPCVLIAAQIGEVRTGAAFLAILPLVLVSMAIIFLSIMFPDIVLFLPRTFMPNLF